MSKQQVGLSIIAAAAIALVATWLYPPWVHYARDYRYSHIVNHPHGWYSVFDGSQDEQRPNAIVFRVDFARLMLLDLVILLVFAGAFSAATSRRNET